MRGAASNANVSWNYQKIQYKKNGIGYPHSDDNDISIIRDELKRIIGYKPKAIDEPTIETQTDQTQ
jgi:hypothetical protein